MSTVKTNCYHILGVTFALMTVTYTILGWYYEHHFKIRLKPRVENPEPDFRFMEKHTCKIPIPPIWPQYYSQFNKSKHPIHDCSYEKNLAMINDDDQSLVSITNLTCCVQEIIRGRNDRQRKLSECEDLKRVYNVSGTSALFVNCDNFTNVFANFPAKPIVLSKLNYWKKIPEKYRPFSIYIFGFDSVSRSHVYRSVPKTLGKMKDMGFLDFQAYHSAAASTLRNFMAILIGLTRGEVRRACAKDWTTPFDKCPFIWKEFDARRYVTCYIEDGHGTFNWGGQSGFETWPTDYNFHHLFQALLKVRRTQAELQKRKLWQDCTSTETIPEFMLRTSERFLRKFSDAPFFLMNWFAEPFHEEVTSALAGYDDRLLAHFGFISKQPQLLRKAFIIFLGDHGDRIGHYSGRSFESYLEKGLPPFFIRMPDQLQESMPEVAIALEANSKVYITPFDVHHTLHHILHLNSHENVQDQFQPILGDKSSLLVHIPTNRTCASTKIAAGNCLCNLEYIDTTNATVMMNKKFAKKMLKIALTKLNSIVNKSGYGSLCAKWKSKADKIVYTDLVSQTQEFQKVLLVFLASPEECRFEATLRISLDSSKNPKFLINSTEVLHIHRSSTFGSQSWCIPSSTDEDKEMKAFCFCKHQEVRTPKRMQ